MNVLQNNDLRTLFDRYGLDYSVNPATGYGAVAILKLDCMGLYDVDLVFYEDHAVLKIWADHDTGYRTQCRETDYCLRLKMPIWVAEHIAQETTHRQKEES